MQKEAINLTDIDEYMKKEYMKGFEGGKGREKRCNNLIISKT